MADHAVPRLPRIALVFGDDAAVAHVREAIQGHLEIAHATTAASFDAARMAQAHVDAVLVNLDDGGWLEAVEAGLAAAAVPVVYNDPEISRSLEGWARARWLRHLLAKLRGSTDVDPPRPGQAGPRAGNPPDGPEDSQAPVRRTPGVFERPLSPQEIETMTADFVQDSAGTPAGPSAQSAAADAPKPPIERREESGAGCADDLEVDTETLSAMIDARLADAESRAPDSTEVWRVVEGGTESPAASDEASPSQATAADAPDKTDAASPGSLNDWQLVDADAEPAPLAGPERKKNPEPELSASLAGLELEPIDIASPVVHTEPIERWLHESESRKPAASAENAEEAESVGDKA